MVGMIRALLMAGANRTLVTLWSVEDLATTEFMLSFYTRPIKENKNYEEALRETKLEFIKSKKYSHPYFWFPFVIYSK